MNRRALIVFLFFLASAVGLMAQTGVSAIVAVTPADTTQCSPSYYSYVVDSSNYNQYTAVQQGFCLIHVDWPHSMPSSLYAITCSPETGVDAGYLFRPSIAGAQRTTTGFVLGVSFYVNNVIIPASSIFNIVNEDYAAGQYGGQDSPGPIHPVSDLGTMYVDCVASNQ